MTISEQIDSLLSKQKEIDYILATETIKEYLVTWPSNVDSKLWNHRLESLLRKIDEKFEEHRSDNHFTQEEVAYILEIPRFKVEQIERKALRKLAFIIKRKYKKEDVL